jgi:chemotaxis protein MotB
MSDSHDSMHNIIIIKRKKHADHGHHGGAWKIAYADFVTAMMAFFLVMWLINAANEKTRAQVASYFNPIKLTDTSTAKKGLNNPLDRTPVLDTEKSVQTDRSTEEIGKPGSSKAELPGADLEKQENYSEEQLFRNPYGILGLLAGRALSDLRSGVGKAMVIDEVSAKGAQKKMPQRDPFDPYAWGATHDKNEMTLTDEDSEPIKKQQPPGSPIQSEGVSRKGEDQAIRGISSSSAHEDRNSGEPSQPSEAQTTTHASGAHSENVSSLSVEAKDAISIRNRIVEGLKEFSTDVAPIIDVKETNEGILISLTDSLNFNMFSIGSSQPQPKLILIMEKISSIIKKYDGRIVVRGHTDSKQFRRAGDDNWRLSASRAQMAFYMLVRSGLDEQKVLRIEGYADHRLKYPQEPESAGNRRIEILLEAKRS